MTQFDLFFFFLFSPLAAAEMVTLTMGKKTTQYWKIS